MSAYRESRRVKKVSNITVKLLGRARSRWKFANLNEKHKQVVTVVVSFLLFFVKKLRQSKSGSWLLQVRGLIAPLLDDWSGDLRGRGEIKLKLTASAAALPF